MGEAGMNGAGRGASVTLADLVKKYDRVNAVDGVSLDIRSGEFLTLLGPSGSGKTSTLMMIAGFETPTAGDIAIDGTSVVAVPPYRRNIGMVFQNYALFPHLTVDENIGFPLKQRGVPKAEIDQRVQKAAKILELGTFLQRRPRQLSGGQRQRVAMGRAMVREPAVYLMDEPLSNLDAKLRVSMRAELARLHERLRTTTVYVTHDQIEAMTLGERVVVLRDGLIQQVAPPKELYDRPANLFVAAFIGSPQMNLLEATVEDGHVVGAGVRLPVRDGRIPAGIQRVILGIRPTDVAIATPGDARPTLSGTVAVFEDLGAEAHAIMPVDSPRITAEAALAAAETEEDHDGTLLAGDDRAQFTARLDAHSGVTQGAQLTLAIDPNRIHLFDPVSGVALV